MSDEPPASSEPEPVWCAVANVVYERDYGPGGAEKRLGTKHFPPGSKVYAVRFFWGMGGEQVMVVGRHRGSHRYVTMTVSSTHLANWRAELVYSPTVIAQVQAHGEYDRQEPGGDAACRKAEEIAAMWISHGAKTQPYMTRPPRRIDPMNQTAFLVLAALAFLPHIAHADGMMLPRQTDWERERERSLINEPSQKAVINYADGREQLIISPSYQGPPGDFAWVIPVPKRPQVKILRGALFHELARIVEPAPPVPKSSLPEGMAAVSAPTAPPVVVLERETVGAYDVSVLAATDGGALQKWLDRNRYFLPPSARAPLAVYVRKGWTFVACRVKQPAHAHGLQNGVLAPLSLTFPAPQIVYPMRLSGSNPARFDLLLYLLLPLGKPTPVAWPGAHPPHLSSQDIPPDREAYPTLAALGTTALNLHWMKTTVAPSDCTYDYVWSVGSR